MTLTLLSTGIWYLKSTHWTSSLQLAMLEKPSTSDGRCNCCTAKSGEEALDSSRILARQPWAGGACVRHTLHQHRCEMSQSWQRHDCNSCFAWLRRCYPSMIGSGTWKRTEEAVILLTEALRGPLGGHRWCQPMVWPSAHLMPSVSPNHSAQDRNHSKCGLFTGMLIMDKPYLLRQRLCQSPSAPLLMLSLWAWMVLGGRFAQQRRCGSGPSLCLAQHRTGRSAGPALGSQQRCRPGRTMCGERVRPQPAYCLMCRGHLPLGPPQSQVAAQPKQVPGQPRTLHQHNPGPHHCSSPPCPRAARLGSSQAPSLAILHRCQWPHPGSSRSGYCYDVHKEDPCNPQPPRFAAAAVAAPA